MAGGTFGGGTGTALDPYIIEDSADLDAIRLKLTSSYKLKNDIDMSAFAGFIPIGVPNFSGKLNGNGFKIKNLTINSNLTYVGVFSRISGGLLERVILENISVTSIGTGTMVGGLAGLVDGATRISQSSTSGTITGNGASGGLFGAIMSGVIVETSSSSCIVNGNVNVGGLIGQNYSSTVQNCYATGKVSGTNKVGGLVGSQEYNSTIKNCYASGEVGGSYSVGGLVGGVDPNGNKLQNSFALNTYINRSVGSVDANFGDLFGSSTFAQATSSTTAGYFNCYSLDSIVFRQL